MNRPLALFDIDKTMFNGLSYFPLLNAQIEAGLVNKSVGEKADSSMQRYKEGSLGYEDFVKELLDIYAAGLQGKSEAKIQDSTNKFFKESAEFFEYVTPTIKLLSSSHEVVLVTGSSNFTAKAVAEAFGVQNYVSTGFEVKDGIITGKVTSYLASYKT